MSAGGEDLGSEAFGAMAHKDVKMRNARILEGGVAYGGGHGGVTFSRGAALIDKRMRVPTRLSAQDSCVQTMWRVWGSKKDF